MRDSLAEEKRIHESTAKKLEITRGQLEAAKLELEQTKAGWDAYKKEARLAAREKEKEWEVRHAALCC